MLNSWVYLVGFTTYFRPTISIFKSMFTVSTKVSFDHTYTIFGADMDMKKKFRGSLSKVRDWKPNFIVVKKLAPIL